MYKVGEVFFWLGFVLMIVCVPLTLGLQALMWLANGEWPSFSPDVLTQVPYPPSTSLIGLNKIIIWFWQNTIIYSIIPLSILCLFIASRFHEDFKNW